MSWDAAVDQITPHVVKIETPSVFGSGFLAFYNYDKSWCGIATAAHVVSHADEWQEPLKIHCQASGAIRFLKSDERVIYIDRVNDSAIVLFFKGDFKLPEAPIGLLPVGASCSIGIDVGWLGFPVIESNTLCFFSGTVSARQEARRSYLIDGVAINGVSGGPVFHWNPLGMVEIIGTISAYHANRATGETLPGLLRAQDVSHFHEVLQYVRSIDEATIKKRELEESQKKKAAEGATVEAKAAPTPAGATPDPDIEVVIPPDLPTLTEA